MKGVGIEDPTIWLWEQVSFCFGKSETRDLGNPLEV